MVGSNLALGLAALAAGLYLTVRILRLIHKADRLLTLRIKCAELWLADQHEPADTQDKPGKAQGAPITLPTISVVTNGKKRTYKAA